MNKIINRIMRSNEKLCLFVALLVTYSCFQRSNTIIDNQNKQYFNIKNTNDTTIVCKRGTKLLIPKNTFRKNGNIISEVRIEIIELYTLDEILKQNIMTFSNDKLIETFGMINIEAFNDNEKIILENGNFLNIYFPKKFNSDQAKLFYGNNIDGQIVWEIDKKCDYPQIYATYNRSSGKKLVVDNIDFLEFLLCNFNFLEEDTTNSNFTHYKFKILRSNEIIDIEIDYLNNKSLRNRLMKFLKNIEKHDLNYDYIDSINDCFLVEGFLIFNQGKNWDYFNSETDINIEESEYFEFRIKNLGWLNADKYIEFQDSIDITLNIVYNPDIECKIALKDPRCVIKAIRGFDNKYLFKNLPKNKSALLYVEKIKGKKVYYYIDTLNTNIEKIGSFKLQRFSKEKYNKDMEIVRGFWDTK